MELIYLKLKIKHNIIDKRQHINQKKTNNNITSVFFITPFPIFNINLWLVHLSPTKIDYFCKNTIFFMQVDFSK
jgi:hypothetical protein